MTGERVIGAGGSIPWDLPADRQLFRRLTEGNTVIMGRATFNSLPTPLPNRHNIVISRTLEGAAGVSICRNFLEGVALGWRLGRPLFVIGGVELYRKALPIADFLHVSWVDGEYAGDRHFPPLDLAQWEAIETVAYPGFRHITYRRR